MEELIEVPPEQALRKCSDWHAWYVDNPPGQPTLYVTGKCEVPQSNCEVRLRRRDQQGANLKELLLERTVVMGAADGWAVGELEDPLVTTRETRYEEKTGVKYETVRILPDDVTVRVDGMH